MAIRVCFFTIALCFLKQASSSLYSEDYEDEGALYRGYEYHLSTKTPYRFIENVNDTEINYDGCVPKRIWSVIRHGTRTAGRETADAIRSRLLEIRDVIVTHYNSSKLERFQRWRPHPELDDQKRLTRVGEEEMLDLGEKFGNRFPSVLPDVWSNTTYMFRFTDTSRTRASANHFATGLFGAEIAQHIWFPEPSKKDPILRFYKLCERWRKTVKKNAQSLIELDRFLNAEVFQAVIRNVSKRLGIPSGILNNDDIQLMYTTCCFETSWDKENVSPWCTLFSTNEFKVLEYAEDLEYYWIDGYGFDLTTKIPCVMLKDAINHLKNKDDQAARFYFTHSGTILKFLSHLGLYRDIDKLRHDNFPQNENRQWKTSAIDVFASNIAFVKFDCVHGEHILTLHQERPVKLPGCPNSDLCPLHKIEQTYSKGLLDCDFKNMCFVDDKGFYENVVNLLWNSFMSLRELYL